MMTHAKFLFDEEFGDTGQSAIPKPTFTAEDLAAARMQGVEDGRQQALKDMAMDTELKIGRLLSLAEELIVSMDKEREQIAAEAVELARVSAEFLADTLIAQQPDATLKSLFEDCISHLPHTPHLAVRTPESNVEELRSALARIAEAKGFDGRVIVLSEPHMDSGDCQIEWADGSVIRNRRKLHERLKTLIARHLSTDITRNEDDDEDDDTHDEDDDTHGENE